MSMLKICWNSKTQPVPKIFIRKLSVTPLMYLVSHHLSFILSLKKCNHTLNTTASTWHCKAVCKNFELRIFYFDSPWWKISVNMLYCNITRFLKKLNTVFYSQCTWSSLSFWGGIFRHGIPWWVSGSHCRAGDRWGSAVWQGPCTNHRHSRETWGYTGLLGGGEDSGWKEWVY